MKDNIDANINADLNISELEQSIGITFSDKNLLRLAMTHSSYDVSQGNRLYGNNERLEFLGDRVLGLIIASLVFHHNPSSNEGDLALYYNALVRKETCTKVAKSLNLERYILLGTSEKKSTDRRKQSILGNLIEALLGAIYLDQGFSSAEKFVTLHWAPLLAQNEKPMRDAKTALQEWAQAKGMPVPDYIVKNRTGPDHAPVFTIEVSLKGYNTYHATQGSKRRAQQEAARKFLIAQQIWDEE